MEIINVFEKYNTIKLNYKIVERRPGDVAAVYADVTKAAAVLNWKAESGLKEMVASAWNWQPTLM